MPIVEKNVSFKPSDRPFTRSTPLVGEIYDRHTARRQRQTPSPQAEREEEHETTGPAGAIDAMADLLLEQSALTSRGWGGALALMRSHLGTVSFRHRDIVPLSALLHEDLWASTQKSLSALLEFAWRDFDSGPSLLIGEVSGADYRTVVTASGGGFMSEGIDFDIIDED
ncbi:hypothetical protein HH310_06905 [Actinoplanes sp. TBRC 11911]|uniref:hypothetical protein n=1 Tax=Actinoplanes sp. TBRC 11911 TaxID=2729386 RepID=UPI00145F8B24|nr:hypothetical protein [Actinoplanes sp. TBRC 11911]NMO50920.1 hypothetical protein [Actinoplanes sp. TBRC 11911]